MKKPNACWFIQGFILFSEMYTLVLKLLKLLCFFFPDTAYVFTLVHRLGGRCHFCHFYFDRTEWHVGVWCGGLYVTLAFLIYKIRVQFLHFSLGREKSWVFCNLTFWWLIFQQNNIWGVGVVSEAGTIKFFILKSPKINFSFEEATLFYLPIIRKFSLLTYSHCPV